jgi:hypothetical protein
MQDIGGLPMMVVDDYVRGNMVKQCHKPPKNGNGNHTTYL